jgi:RsiW-degrading membrane proteinase PrsW (M82 family)
MFCDWKSKASKRYQITVLIEMAAYVLILLGEKTFLGHHNPVGIELYALAALPTVPIIAVLVSVGIYLRDEKDEYQRDLMVKSMLWGTAGVLSLSTFLAFLHSFGWTGSVSPFTEFVAFWLLVAAAKAFYKLMDRVPADE